MQRITQHHNNNDACALGPQLAGEKLSINNNRMVQVMKQLGEGGFSYVYLVKDIDGPHSHLHHHSSENPGASSNSSTGGGSSAGSSAPQKETHMVLKITSIHSRQQRDIAEKEAKLLSRLSHPSIVRMMDACYRSTGNSGGNQNNNGADPASDNGGKGGGSSSASNNASPPIGSRPQHMILMEYCEGGTALNVCQNLKAQQQRFDLSSLIIAFGQICNAVSYLHAQRPPIVHRDLKPVNFLVKNGAYKLCDFGSAVFGHVDLKTSRARAEAEEVIEKTTTQMFRSPEMVDLYMARKLTQSTDVWALGCCLYSLAFFQNCFEEGSNLAILSRNYKIPEDNPYGEGLVELIDRMLTVDPKARADMTEVILCLSAIYSGRPLPPRKRVVDKKSSSSSPNGDNNKGKSKDGNDNQNGSAAGATETSTPSPSSSSPSANAAAPASSGTFRTDGQGIVRQPIVENRRPAEARKLNPNSAAARRKAAMQSGGGDGTTPKATEGSSSSRPSSNGLVPPPRRGPPPQIRATDGENNGGNSSSNGNSRSNNKESTSNSFSDSFTTMFPTNNSSGNKSGGGGKSRSTSSKKQTPSAFADNPFDLAENEDAVNNGFVTDFAAFGDSGVGGGGSNGKSDTSKDAGSGWSELPSSKGGDVNNYNTSSNTLSHQDGFPAAEFPAFEMMQSEGPGGGATSNKGGKGGISPTREGRRARKISGDVALR